MTLADGAEGFDASEGGFGTGQGPEPAHGFQSLLQRGMVAFDTVVEVFAIDMTDRAVWPPPFVNFADDLGIAVRLAVRRKSLNWPNWSTARHK